MVPCPGSLAGANFALCLGVAVPWPLSASMSRAVSDPCDHLPPWRSVLAVVAHTLDRMLSVVSRKGGQIGCCGTCMDARGITDAMLVPGAARSTMDELTEWTLAAEKVLVF